MADSNKQNFWLKYGIIIVASLGYFVDIYDLILFNVVKKESLTAIMFGAYANDRHVGWWFVMGHFGR